MLRTDNVCTARECYNSSKGMPIRALPEETCLAQVQEEQCHARKGKAQARSAQLQQEQCHARTRLQEEQCNAK